MEEKILKGNKTGMAVLLLTIVLYIAAVCGIVWAAVALDGALFTVIMTVCITWCALG